MSSIEQKARNKAQLRKTKVKQLAAATRAASRRIGVRMYNVIYADPPWRFEPRSRDTGMDRAADNHYPTMPFDQIVKLKLPAAPRCALFLWATVPMLPQALHTMQAWGFAYKSHWIWYKPKRGTGFWNFNQHEVLLIGTRGGIPAPTPGTQPPSVLAYNSAGHSKKPHEFRGIISKLYPNVPKLEMFARGKAPPGWDFWGNEVDHD